MRAWLMPMLASMLAAAAVPAAEPMPAKGAACLMLDNRVLGPRSGERPFPVYVRDATGFRPACAVPWRTLSPHNQPLPVVDCCCKNSMLQVASGNACGRSTGPLWVDSRWVVTSAELQEKQAHAATCQQLETGAWAGTRAYEFDCVPQKKELKPAAESGPKPPDAQPAAPATLAPARPAPAAPAVPAVPAAATPRPDE